MTVVLRTVAEADLPIFFEHQLEPEATRMAAFRSREWDAFQEHWRKILGEATVVARTILHNGQVVGNVVSFVQSGEREVGYWLGQAHWGRGLATQALEAFLGEIEERPLYAHVARHNLASRRVLEKCGFRVVGEDPAFSTRGGEQIEGLILRLEPAA
jgi:RimJ/RimL family protein N-acetyltransferase